MNKYFALRKTNRMRTELLTEKSQEQLDRKSTRLNSSHKTESRMPSSA